MSEITTAVTEALTDAVTGEAGAITGAEFSYKGILGLLAEKGEIHVALWIGAVILCAAIGYFLGSINFAVVISKIFFKDDIRKYGSGNAGATNMSRVYGKGAGIATLAGDVLKAVASVIIAKLLCGDVIAYMAGFFCALGHAFPCYYKFKGGKCVAVTAAMALAIDPVIFAILLLVFAVVVIGTKYVSLASISAAFMYPIVMHNIMEIRFGHGDLRVIFVLATCALVVFLHKENIKRLLDGKENKFSFKKKEKK